jgi:glycosyltransferase involved in cell wall biosynthesis
MSDVTVLMTVYNGMPYLPAAVESVLGQTLRELRFVIVDDGSTDGTADYLRGIADPRVVVLRQENRGTAAAANFGLQHCETDFVARMDADDIALPTRLERQRDFLLAHPEVGLLGTQVAPLGSVRTGRSMRLPTAHAAIDGALLAGRHALAHSSIMMRSALLKRLGGYWSLPLVDDWDMMLRMGETAELANLDDVLHLYRFHEGSLNGKGMRRMRFSVEYACELARRRRGGQPPISPEVYEMQLRSRPWWRRAYESLDLHGRCQYRLAQAELYGRRPLRGKLRLSWAAACSPGLTLARIRRVFRAKRWAHD